MTPFDPQLIQEILVDQAHNIEAGLISAFPNNGLKHQLNLTSHNDGNGKVMACLSYLPSLGSTHESIDLSYTVSCNDKGAILASEIAWSDGKTIDEVVVCKMCPDCMDDLKEEISSLLSRNQGPILERMVELLSNFQ